MHQQQNNSDFSSTTPSSKGQFLHQSLPPTPTWTSKGSNNITSPLQNSLCHPLSSLHERSVKTFSCLTPPNPKALMVFQQSCSKPMLLNLPLFLTNYFSFPTLLAHSPPRGNKPMSFISKKGDKLLFSGDQGGYSSSSDACQNHQKLNSFIPIPTSTA